MSSKHHKTVSYSLITAFIQLLVSVLGLASIKHSGKSPIEKLDARSL